MSKSSECKSGFAAKVVQFIEQRVKTGGKKKVKTRDELRSEMRVMVDPFYSV